MKKYLAVFLALLMVLSLAACGGGNDTPDPSGSGDPGTSQQEQTDNSDNDTEDNSDSPVLTGDADDETKPENNDDKWPDNDFTKQIPAPDFAVSSAFVMGNIFTAVLEDITVDELRSYAEQVKEAGYTIEPGGMDADGVFQYSAYNEAGYWVFIGKDRIEMNAPEE